MDRRIRQFLRLCVSVAVAALGTAGCAHYPVNQALRKKLDEILP